MTQIYPIQGIYRSSSLGGNYSYQHSMSGLRDSFRFKEHGPVIRRRQNGIRRLVLTWDGSELDTNNETKLNDSKKNVGREKATTQEKRMVG